MPILLYSTNTWLACQISRLFYGDRHWVWCSPYFGRESAGPLNASVPPSSSPLEIYLSLRRDVSEGDRHSSKIERNRIGILKGAERKLGETTITEAQEREIRSVVDRAQISDFRPLLYVIPYGLVQEAVRPVPVNERAHPLSEECIVESLERPQFDIIEFPNRTR